MRPWRALLLAVPLLGVAELGLHFFFAKRAPAFEDWGAVRAPVLGLAEASAPVIVAPRWAEPMARQALGDERMPLSHVARADVSRFERAVEISLLGQRSPELSGWLEEARETVGKIELRRLKNPAFRPVIVDFVERARPPFAEVYMSLGQQNCPWNEHAKVMSGGLGGNPTFPAQRFECPAGIFFGVGETVIPDENFVARRCLWSHPPQSGEVVTRFADVALGETIEGHSGMSWMIEREGRGAPVVLRVRVDGEEVGHTEHRDGQGFAPFRFELGAHARAAHAKVEIGVSSVNYLHRHFCYEATSR